MRGEHALAALRTSTRPHAAVVLAVVLTVGALVSGPGATSATRGALTAATASTRPVAFAARTGGALDLDLRPVTRRATIARCLVAGFATRPGQVSVLYGVRQKLPRGSVAVLILRNRAGRVRLCDRFGGDYPAQLPAPRATRTRPVVFYSTGRRYWSCEQSTQRLRRFTLTQWLSTRPVVHSVRLRFVVNGVPRRWFATRPVNGFAHVQAWLSGPLPRSARLAVEQRALDGQGRVLRHTRLPAHQRLAGCTNGSVQIG
jgi:hypothetical protein